jgi:hypothetical protein
MRIRDLPVSFRSTDPLHGGQWRVFLKPFACGGVCGAKGEFDALVGDPCDFLKVQYRQLCALLARTRSSGFGA